MMQRLKYLTLILGFVVKGFAVDGASGWELTEYVWNWGIVTTADIGPGKDPIQYFDKDIYYFDPSSYQVKSGDIVWVKTSNFPQFYETVVPTISQPCVLIVSIGDGSFPTNCLIEPALSYLLSNPNIVHIFAQNYDYNGDSGKVTPIPIGVDFHTIAYAAPLTGVWGEIGSAHDQEAVLKQVLSGLHPTNVRKKRAYVDFHLNDTTQGLHRRDLQFGETRAMIFSRLCQTGLIDYREDRIRRSDLWRIKGEYAFSICPYGNGVDTHRVWEDLILGCIPIVKSSPLNSLYQGLPVVIVNDWSELTEANLERWYEQYGDAFTNPSYREKLTNCYWIEKIRSAALPYRGR